MCDKAFFLDIFKTELPEYEVPMFGRHLPLSEQALQVIEQIGEDMPGGFFIYKATGNEELLYANKAVFTAVIRAMTTYARRIPIVAMTANAFADDIRKAKEVGMNDHISKPIDFKELAKILQKWIRV